MHDSIAALAVPLLSFCLLPLLSRAASAPLPDQNSAQEVLLWKETSQAKKLFHRQPYEPYYTMGGKLPTEGTYLLSPDKASLAWMTGAPHSESIYLNGALWGGPYSKTYGTFMGGPEYGGGNYYGFEPYATFSPDGKHMLARVEQTNGTWKAVLDGKDLPGEYEKILDISFAGPDSSKIALTVKRGKQYILLLDGTQIGGEYDRESWSWFSRNGGYQHGSSIGALSFSKDGAHFTFRAKRQGKLLDIVDGK